MSVKGIISRKHFIVWIFFGTFIFIASCAPKPRVGAPKVIQWEVDKSYVVNQQRLKKGGALLITPFFPGAGVEATPLTERMALKAVQGMVEVLRNQGALFKILTASNAEKADLTMKGEIRKFLRPHGIKKWLSLKKPVVLKMNGKIRDEKTGEVILYFSESVTSTKARDEKAYLEMAYQLGKKIGKFIAVSSRGNQ